MGVDHFIELNDARFRYQDWGDPEGPVVVFLHGVLLSADPYEAIVDRITGGGHRVIALDQRGHGQSAHTGNYSWEAFVEDLAALWAALDLGSADVVGHSMGGNMACRFAALHPGSVRRLVLVDAPLAAEASPDELAFWDAVAKLQPPDRWESREAFIDRAMELFPRAEREAVSAQSRGLVAGEDGRFDAEWMPDLAVMGHSEPPPEEEWELCARVRSDVLVVRAEHSELLTREGAARVMRAFPAATLAELPRSGHMVNWENPSGVADLSLAFLA